ncbi:hypothetical protein K470DRAFT_254275 [Piedraia hortae CBS 480.64]|uniref:DASH complex subunit DAD2 n=1 Tax=Piedraia hortae CBS 480.64 TaxID=1314780 RepID=A0A6A7C8R8_9PEZI|nr:hypothetical protein K470DRAFT_254275 [Piedraia hortae CBS 480.64]
MSHAHRQTILPTHIRQSSAQSSTLQARVNAKKAELENLRQLRDLSADLACQMQNLEAKLATLNSGTECLAAVLGNWHNVLRAIHMASLSVQKTAQEGGAGDVSLPQTLVRIPIHQAEAMQKELDAVEAASAEE